MIVLTGQSVTPLAAVGAVHCFSPAVSLEAVARRSGEAEEELQRLEAALAAAGEELQQLSEQAREKAGEENALLFEVHAMLLEDDDFLDAVREKIAEESVCAEYAVAQVGLELSDAFAHLTTSYMQQRASDMRDVSSLVVRCLTGAGTDSPAPTEPYILVADDLSPSDTVRLDRSLLLGFLTAKGSLQSHVAILARSMNIPALVDVGTISADWEGRTAAIDGASGRAYVDPEPDLLDAITALQQQDRAAEEALHSLIGAEDVTPEGRHIRLYANIGSPKDLEAVLQNDARGVGLFRTEFLYMESTGYPDEETQLRAYRTVLEAMGDKPVVVRTLDIGADKQIPYFQLEQEANPALGKRAIRLCLERPELLHTQLRALYRASAYGRLAIMFPMIASLWEIRELKQHCAAVRAQLQAEGQPMAQEVPIGIMVETPAAALLAEDFAKEVDFLSIGTNDLTQYLLAVDRQQPGLERYFDPHHPALLGLLRHIAASAHRCGIWVGICGELAGDTSLTPFFAEIGIDELSVSPSRILPLRAAIRGAT